jgi:hypothetical protein
MSDGLTPPGEQLGLFPEDEVAESVSVVVVHRIAWGGGWWRCACGAGRHGLQSYGIARGAAGAHMRAARKRAARSPDRP